MHPSLEPLAVHLQIGGEAIPALSYSEAGIVLPLDALRSSSPGYFLRGHGQPATLRLSSDESCDAYPVEIKLAGSSTFFVELAFSALPAQARLRMRHATGSVLSDPALKWIADADMDLHDTRGETLPDGRRFALRTSAPLWDVTRRRRGPALPPQKPRSHPSNEVMPRPTHIAEEPARTLPRADVLFLGCLSVLVVALLLVMGG